MALFKITASDLMPGSEAWWHKQSAINHPERAAAATPSVQAPDAVRQQQVAAMRAIDPQMPTRTRGGGVRQPGIDENELNDFAAQGNGETGLSAKEPTQKQYEKIAADRTSSNLPEQVVKTPVDHTQRVSVDADDVTDPARQRRINRFVEDINGTAGSVDSYGKMLEFLKARQQVDADADKRARRREMMAAIGDGISALSSLYQTTQGAPVTYTPGHDMSEVMRQRYDRYIAQRKADEDKYLNYLKVQHDAEQDKMNQEYRLARAKYYEEEATRKANESSSKINREDMIAEAKKNEIDSRARKNEADTIKKKGENQYAVTYWGKLAEYLEAGRPEEEAKKLANADAAAAEQEVLNAKEQQKANESTAKVNNLKRKGTGRGSSKSNKGSTKSAQSNTPPSRRSGNTNNNNVRPSQRK